MCASPTVSLLDPLGQYRDRVGTNVEMVYRKVVKKA